MGVSLDPGRIRLSERPIGALLERCNLNCLGVGCLLSNLVSKALFRDEPPRLTSLFPLKPLLLAQFNSCPTCFGLCVPTLEDPVLGAGLARMYNRWASEFCAKSAGRLHGVAVVPIEHGEDAVAVMEEAKELGLVATIVPPALKDRNLDHPDMDRFYAAAASIDMPLGVHGAPGIHLPKIGVDRFDNYIQVHCVSFPFDQMFAMTVARERRRLRPAPHPARGVLGGGSGVAPVVRRAPGRALRVPGRLDPRRLAAPTRRVRGGGQHRRHVRARRGRAAVRGGAARRPLRDVRQRLPPLGRRVASGHDRIERARPRVGWPTTPWRGWRAPTPRTSTSWRESTPCLDEIGAKSSGPVHR